MAYFNISTNVVENDTLALEYMTETSLRLIRLIYKPTGTNLFAELPDFNFDTARGKYYIRGGHRLWVSPETFDVTYAPETPAIEVVQEGNAVILRQNGDPVYRLSKEIRIQVDPKLPNVHLVHKVLNAGEQPIECGPWGLSMLKPGGTAILPLLPPPSEGEKLLPDRNVVLWSYTSLQDPRLKLTNNVVFVQGTENNAAFKIGSRSPQGWLAYLNQGIAFVVRSKFNNLMKYPDFGCNQEVYTNGKFVEMEMLGGIVNLAPGQMVELEEEWNVFPFDGSAELLYDRLIQK
jgi:hypothetical protein